MSSVVVFTYLPGEDEAVPAGILTITQTGNDMQSKFVYGTRYLDRPNAIALDPVSLSLPRVPGEEIVPVRNLSRFGAFVDATPDDWGRRIIEKYAGSGGELPEMAYILNSGHDRVGALDFRERPDSPPAEFRFNHAIDLKDLIECAERIEQGIPVPRRMLDLLEHGSSMGGARPKAVVEDADGLWIAKFNSREDRFDYARTEAATLSLARECGIVVPDTKVVDVAGKSVLMVRRFDREKTPNGYLRRHFLSALTLLGKSEGESRGSAYADICAAIARHCRAAGNEEMKIELFRRMVYNILVHNRDDHLKNFGFLYEKGGYVLSPAYDVVPFPTVTGERYQHLSVGVQGQLSTLDNAMSQVGIFGLTKEAAGNIIDDMVSVVSGWRDFFLRQGVSSRDVETLERAFRPVSEIWREADPGSSTAKPFP